MIIRVSILRPFFLLFKVENLGTRKKKPLVGDGKEREGEQLKDL